ncbi:MAG: sigma-54 dependent transcriptional regulator [Desulfobulbaceae bacterium]|nr:sigma-54 dependent transcriptional regulator [Desulfobulbaceae bacterium]
MAYILIVDDEPKMRHILKIMLDLKGHTTDQAQNGIEALEMLEDRAFDLVISDIKMPEMDGLSLLDRIQHMESPCPVIIITAFATVDSAVNAMKRGAVDYITKPFDEEKIIITVEKAIGISRILAENRMLKNELKNQDEQKELVCASEPMKKLLTTAVKVARQPDTTVLITGESGTGKEVIARFVHKKSPRAAKRFVAINCAAISPNLVESTLFGHEKGAFTGADKRKEGVFEYAEGGTLFLDEVGDLPLEAQAKLLRAMQEKSIQRVGGNQQINIDLRVICATNRQLMPLVDEGKFRLDLYYRINVFPIHIPPLRERNEAIIPLAEHFVRKFMDKTGENTLLSSGATRILLAHTWPGNVRELANAVERACILAGDPPVVAEDLTFLETGLKISEKESQWKLPKNGISLEALESDLIRQAVEMTGNNQSAAAKLLGLSRSKFRTRVKSITNYELQHTNHEQKSIK